MYTSESSMSYSFGAQPIGCADFPCTRFRLWAPGMQSVGLEIEGHPPIPMNSLPGGWFEVDAGCGAGSRYKFRVSSALAVPDPASRLQAGDIHDASVVWDHRSYRWKNTAWRGRPWHETVLYEVHPGLMGGFKGIERKLPELAELGITAIELMPISDFPGKHNWGYDGVLPYAPDAAYGSPDQLKEMIDTAHGLGMMVFLDVVYNHFGPDGNYLGAYAPAFFRDDVHTPWGQAIDFRQRAVRDYFTENAIYWLNEFRFDGLRFDAVHAISEKDWLVEMAQQVRSRVIAGRHIHLVLENDENLAYLLEGKPDRLFDAQWNDDIHHAYHVLLTGENEGYYAGYSDRPSGRLARGLAEGFIYQGEAALYPGAEPRGERSSHLPPTAFVDFLQNHDQIGNRAFGERLTTLADPHALRAAMAMLLLSPHIPMLFMGDEIGAKQPFLYFTSHPDLALANAVRDGRRQEFARFAAFSDPEKRALIPDPNAESTFFASLPKEDDSAPYWRRWVKTLLEIRHRDIMPRLANARSFGAQALGSAGVLGRWMMGDGSVLSLSVNLDRQPVAVPTAASPDQARLLFETEGAANCARQGELPAHAMLALLEPAP